MSRKRNSSALNISIRVDKWDDFIIAEQKDPDSSVAYSFDNKTYNPVIITNGLGNMEKLPIEIKRKISFLPKSSEGIQDGILLSEAQTTHSNGTYWFKNLKFNIEGSLCVLHEVVGPNDVQKCETRYIIAFKSKYPIEKMNSSAVPKKIPSNSTVMIPVLRLAPVDIEIGGPSALLHFNGSLVTFLLDDIIQLGSLGAQIPATSITVADLINKAQAKAKMQAGDASYAFGIMKQLFDGM